MCIYSEPFPNGSCQGQRAQRRIARPELYGEVQNLRREFVAFSGSSLLGQKPEEAISLKVGFRLIVGRAREAECCSGLSDGLLVDRNTAKHLVLELQKVVAIEEIASFEQSVCYRVRMRVERAVPLEGVSLGLFGRLAGHCSSPRNIAFRV